MHIVKSHVNFERESRYRFQTLGQNEIRLLQIHKPVFQQPEGLTAADANVRESPFEYSIVQIPIDDAPPYEAVSYVWGGTEYAVTIHLKNQECILATASLAYALPYLAKACVTNYLWIDQITIDQSNLAERNAQVHLMGQIYYGSFRCLVWLDDGATLHFPSMIELEWEYGAGEDVRELLRSFRDESNQEAEDRSDSLQSLRRWSTSKHAQIREHLLWFFEHPWFTRTWVYTEYLLAKRAVFLIGDFSLPSEELQNVFEQAYPRSNGWFDIFKHRLNLDQGRAFLFQKAPGMEFLLAAHMSHEIRATSAIEFHRNSFVHYESLGFTDILRNMSSSQTTDDRDHVYAFLGLAPFLSRHMKVDYTASIEEVFSIMAKAIVQESGTLDFLDALPLGEVSKSQLKLPSWVPNLTLRYSVESILCHDNLFTAAGEGYGLPSMHECRHYARP